MNHLSETELIQYHYGESARLSECKGHIQTCPECADAYAALMVDIARLALELDAMTIPDRGAEYGDAVWRSLQPLLVPHEGQQRHGWRRLFSPSGWKMGLTASLALAVAAAILVAAAFYSGRLWEQKRAPAIAKDNGASTNQQATQRVILLVLSDHLDRSERLLVELNHPEEAAVDPALQTTARQLLAENESYRLRAAGSSTSTASTGTIPNYSTASPAVAITLDDLDRVLAQVAANPDGLSQAAIARLQKEMNTSGLLFEVRVLRSRVRNSRQNGVAISRPISKPISRQGGTA
ncbi:hypothetical protein [Acidicapsa ligni]|uniref:hypothetical protein n=1 Tax=Acidicapsa ligni TaxID=542300 RepID=UPI0021DF5D22|nr:hypothetical protein [Acidicapsa ligni]